VSEDDNLSDPSSRSQRDAGYVFDKGLSVGQRQRGFGLAHARALAAHQNTRHATAAIRTIHGKRPFRHASGTRQSGRTVTLYDDALTRRKHAGFHHPAEKAASTHHSTLEIGMDCVQHITRLTHGGEFKNEATLKTKPGSGWETLDVHSSHGNVLAHDARPDDIALSGKLLDQFKILNRNGTIRPAVFLMIVAVPDKAVRRDLHPVNWPFRYTARRHAHGDDHAGRG
jgi:hypothetical protein